MADNVHSPAPEAKSAEPQSHSTDAHAGAPEHHPTPTALGLDAPAWIALAMVLVFAILLWKRVPAAIGRALDAKIALIRNQLAEAETLRKEAETLKAEYEAKAKSADKEAESLIERARHEADEIVAKARDDAEALVARRTKIAEEKIAAEERAAVSGLRAVAADAAARAAARLIVERTDAGVDKKLVDQAIAEIARR